MKQVLHNLFFRKSFYRTVKLLLMLLSALPHLSAQQTNHAVSLLKKEYNLVIPKSKDTQYYVMESRLEKFQANGTVQGIDVYRLYLRCVPAAYATKKDEYTSLKFTVQSGDAPPKSIPALAGWKYFFSLDEKMDSKGQLFGIDHGQFEKLTDETGLALPVEHTYHVYNAFIDFHAMGVFSERTVKDSGIQDLKRIGDKTVHEASYSQPPVHLGSHISKGSYFKNGKVTLEFKGLGISNGKPSAILGYDSGESSFHMLTNPMPNLEVATRGRSHYWGDIYKGLEDGWIHKAALHEMVISETTVPGMENKIHAVIERTINIQSVKRFTFGP